MSSTILSIFRLENDKAQLKTVSEPIWFFAFVLIFRRRRRCLLFRRNHRRINQFNKSQYNWIQ